MGDCREAKQEWTTKLASKTPTWLQTENSKHLVQGAIVAGFRQLRNLKNPGFGPASLTSRTHESANKVKAFMFVSA